MVALCHTHSERAAVAHKMTVLTVVGARPQFIKAAIVSRALARTGIEEVLVHTGQHYDVEMSDIFFRELCLRAPAYNLGIGSGAHGQQTAQMLVELERVIRDTAPDRVLVYGDTNSTLAGALAAAKLAIPVDHVEAGLRSHDRDMPEEINRVLTDQVSDQLYCPTRTAVRNLQREGTTNGVHHTGDVMLDLALSIRGSALAVPLPDGVDEGMYFVATIHRPSNTDDPHQLRRVTAALDDVARCVAPVVLPVHPRLAAALERSAVRLSSVRMLPPVGYREMQGLLLRARGVITDSGGVQKEALFHGRRCLTLRDSTEWLESLDDNWNELVGSDLNALSTRAAQITYDPDRVPSARSQFGDGRAGERIAALVAASGNARRRWHTPNVAG